MGQLLPKLRLRGWQDLKHQMLCALGTKTFFLENHILSASIGVNLTLGRGVKLELKYTNNWRQPQEFWSRLVKSIWICRRQDAASVGTRKTHPKIWHRRQQSHFKQHTCHGHFWPREIGLHVLKQVFGKPASPSPSPSPSSSSSSSSPSPSPSSSSSSSSSPSSSCLHSFCFL